MGALLFNLKDQKVYKGQEWKGSVVKYEQNMLQVGNGEVVLRNKDLSKVKIGLGTIMGHEYFRKVERWEVSGEDTIEVKLDAVEIHRVIFDDA